jgi:UDP-N-acetyl-D-mannosaminuronate dehydrogenase
MLYDLLVIDSGNDHTSETLLSIVVIQYHNVLKEPEMYEPSDVYIPSINNLFKSLKEEQLRIFNSRLKNIESVLQDVQIIITEMQYKLVSLQQEVRRLEDDNKRYLKIARWSIQ